MKGQEGECDVACKNNTWYIVTNVENGIDEVNSIFRVLILIWRLPVEHSIEVFGRID